jgi:microcystin-dependent protein
MEAFLSTVLIWAPNFAPTGWAFCAGQQMSIAQNTALYSLVGTLYGGNGTTTFNLPDLRSRVPVGAGMGPGNGLTNYNNGAMGGLETVNLSVAQMPSHSHGAQGQIVAHPVNATSNTPQAGSTLANVGVPDGPSFSPVNAYATPSGSSVTLAPGSVSVQISSQGGSQAHENRMPFTGLSFIIALEGLYPPRS